MDTAFDFIQPEFFNILFFQQKSVVIFPYVDLKHLRSLDIFAVGYNIVDLDSTALHNVREVLELEKYNSYSQNPSLFFITNVNETQLEEIISLEDIHCVINCHEDISSHVREDKFIFYNKKSKRFLNLTPEDLEFEKFLISSSKNTSILQDRILKIRTIATNIYTELNDSGNARTISKLLAEIDPKHWDKVLNYTRFYYKIEIPDISSRLYTLGRVEKSIYVNPFSDEYDLIVSKNKMIGKEFMQLIHDYRKQKVNSANLSTEQLYYPLKLYDYLRNHHWVNGIDEEFLTQWVSMDKTKYVLNEDDIIDFQYVLQKLKVPNHTIIEIFDFKDSHTDDSSLTNGQIHEDISKKEHQDDKSMFEKLTEIENLIDNDLSSKNTEYLLSEIGEIQTLLGRTPKSLELGALNLNQIPNETIKRILQTAEFDFGTRKTQTKMDATPVIVQYNKGFEMILKRKVAVQFRPFITQYRKKSSTNQTSKEFEKKFGGFLRKKRNISSGKWLHILRDLNNPQNPPDVQDFFNILKSKFDNSSLSIVREICEIIVPLRRAVHEEKIVFLEEILPVIPRFIFLLNLLIEKLF
ncbi:MAG: hypothetical protein ACFFBH_10240 [Promethearchaeota archaeon]